MASGPEFPSLLSTDCELGRLETGNVATWQSKPRELLRPRSDNR